MFPGFLLLLAWLLLPPLLLAVFVMARLRGNSRARMWKQVAFLVVLSLTLEVAFLVLGPDNWGRHLGVRDIRLFGLQTMWAPFAWLAVAIAWPPVYIWSRRNGRNGL